MINGGMMGMPLHSGKPPRWLTDRMGKLGTAIIESVAQNYSKSEVLTRLSNPNWFQAFGAVTGMHWNSSGVTATLLGSLKRKINPIASDLGIYILGGKGKYSYYAPREIKKVSEQHGLKGNELVKSCMLSRKVDSSGIIDGYNIYQQYFILSDEGDWTSITQGMDTSKLRARRYHWHSNSVKSFVSNPHKGIVGKNEGKILNLVDSRADFSRKNIVNLHKENRNEILKAIKYTSLPNRHDVRQSDVDMKRLGAVLDLSYDKGIDNFEDLLMLKGVGPKTIKTLALVSEVIHGDSSRFDDPARFSFAVGGKDGRPHPVDTESYDETIEILSSAVEKSKLGYNDKSKVLKTLHKRVVNNETNFSPTSFLEDFIDSEWDNAEKNGGMTFMGKTIKGLTRAIMSIQNSILYDNYKKDYK